MGLVVGALGIGGVRVKRDDREPVHGRRIRILGDAKVVVAVDDLQWFDLDSLLLLESLFRARDAPPVLFLATLRPDTAGEDALRALDATNTRSELSIGAESMRSRSTPSVST